MGALVSIGLSINYQLKNHFSFGVKEVIVVFIMAISSWLPVLIIAGAWIRHFTLTLPIEKEVIQND